MSRTNHAGITIHEDPAEWDGMRRAGKLAATVLDALIDQVQVGTTTDSLNQFAHDMIVGAGAVPAPLDYRGFPKSICTSVNNVVCHGIPNDKTLRAGDIVNIDVTVIVDGWHGDTSRMYWVGAEKDIPIKGKLLTQTTYDATMKGIEMVRPGVRLGDIGHAIQSYAEAQNYGVVRDYCGHGLGKVFHAAPNVLHYGDAGTGEILEQGMFFTIEPMLNFGKPDTKLNKADGWTVTTKDRSLSCQFEHSIGVTANGFEIFTQSPTGKHCPAY